MDPTGIEGRLASRAQDLSSKPLVSEGLARELRASMALGARREATRVRHRPWSFTLLGAAAALLLLLVVPDPIARFGSIRGAVAFLDPAGRVLGQSPSLRSGDAGPREFPREFLIEIVAEDDGYLAVRIGMEGRWVNPHALEPVKLSRGEDWMQAFPWPGKQEAVLLVFSQRRIPQEILDTVLEGSGVAGIENRLGCHVVTRWLNAELATD